MNKSKNSLFGLTSQAKAHLIQQMLNNRSANADRTATSTKKTANSDFTHSDVPDEFTCFDKFPAYQQLLVHKLVADNLEINSPFFRVHEGIANGKTVIDGRELINFASYNYLGLCGHPDVSAAAKQAIDQYGTTVSASRPVAGERPVQRELENALAILHGVEDCVVFVSGHATNVTAIGYLFGSKDLILHDALIHNSVIEGAKLSGAHRMTFPHNDWQTLDEILTRNRTDFERVLIVIEGIYSMDGDIPELHKFVQIKKRHKSFLMVDEAHSQGVLGDRGLGIGEHFNISGKNIDIWMGTLSKTLASCGGYIAGEHALVEHLKFSAPGFLYSVGISPPLAAAALAALKIMLSEPERAAQLQQSGKLFLKLAKTKGINTGRSEGYSVIPALTGSSITAVKLANALLERGVHVQPIIYPAVEESMARLRFFMSSTHTENQIRYTIDALVNESKKLGLLS